MDGTKGKFKAVSDPPAFLGAGNACGSSRRPVLLSMERKFGNFGLPHSGRPETILWGEIKSTESMPTTGYSIYLSSLLLEKNRSNGKGPSLLVSEWIEPVGEAGFGGLELRMNHLFFSSRSEWELIRERGLEADLTSALIGASLPTDAGDKSQRLRDAILEACDYFRPEGLKLLPPRGEEAMDFLKAWSKDVPRDIELLYDCREGESGLEGLGEARKALAGTRFRAVLHPFLAEPREFEEALQSHGDFIGNLGVQSRKGNAWALLAESRETSLQTIAITRSRGYKGSWTLEFTKGAGLPGENIDRMFDNAESDLNFLTEILARATAEKV